MKFNFPLYKPLNDKVTRAVQSTLAEVVPRNPIDCVCAVPRRQHAPRKLAPLVLTFVQTRLSVLESSARIIQKI